VNKSFALLTRFIHYLVRSSMFCLAGVLTIKIFCFSRMRKVVITAFQHAGQAWNRQIHILRFQTVAHCFALMTYWNLCDWSKI